MQRLKIYEIKKEYIKYLSRYQPHLFYDEGTRKYIGILLEIKGFKYFAPLSSYKQKHKKMNERVDFIKIKDYAVININNMIPVPEGQYMLVDINGTKDPHYKFLLQTESREINRKKIEFGKMLKLYTIINCEMEIKHLWQREHTISHC